MSIAYKEADETDYWMNFCMTMDTLTMNNFTHYRMTAIGF